MPELAAVQASVYGRVQGVFYRAFAREQAIRLGLSGRVRNRPGGTVEIMAEGPKDKLEEFLKDLREGPVGAAVNRVDIRWEDYRGSYPDFRIEY